MSNNNEFPMELVVLVVGYLYSKRDLLQCTYTNKAFHLTANPKLWDSIGENIRFCTMIRAVLPCLRQAEKHTGLAWRPLFTGNHIRRLVFHSAHRPVLIHNVVARASLLEEISLTHVNISDPEFCMIMRRCSHLKRIDLESLPITERAFKPLTNHPALTQIYLQSCHHLSPMALQRLEGCRLEALAMIDCPHLITAETALLIQGFQGLEGLRLSLMGYLPIQKDFVESVTEMIRSPRGFLPKLKQFVLVAEDEWVDDTLLAPLIQTHPDLELLRLDRCFVGEDTLAAMAEHLPVISYIRLEQVRGLTQEFMRKVVLGCPELDNIVLNGYDWPLEYFPDATNLSEFSFVDQSIPDKIHPYATPGFTPSIGSAFFEGEDMSLYF